MTEPDEIRRDIERTRNELSGNVDALGNRVDPRRVAGDKMNQARGRMTAFKDRMMGTAAGDGDGRARMSSATHQAGSSMREAAGSVQHRASSMADTAREKAGHTGHAQRERIQGSPLAAGLVAFGLGVLVSSLLPPSGREQQLAARAKGKFGEHSDEIKQQLSGAAHQVQDNLRQPAQEAAGQVRSRAAEGASTVREQGRSTAQDVRGQATEAQANIRRG